MKKDFVCRHAQLDMSQTQAANCLEMQQTDISIQAYFTDAHLLQSHFIRDKNGNLLSVRFRSGHLAAEA